MIDLRCKLRRLIDISGPERSIEAVRVSSRAVWDIFVDMGTENTV